MKIKTLLFILLVLTLELKASQLSPSGNPVYTLSSGEEFVFGKIGTNDKGALKYTLAIVRKRNENKDFFVMSYRPYMPGIIQGSGLLKPNEKVNECDKYDYWLVFNGKKFGPYDAIYEMNFNEPNVDKWVSNDGKTISFCGQKGNKFMGVVHNNERAYFFAPSQSLSIDPAYNEDIYGISFTENDFRMYINGKQNTAHNGYFTDIKHANNGDMLYFAADAKTKERGIYLNHKNICTASGDYEFGFINGTNEVYYRTKLTDGSTKVRIGDDKFDFEAKYSVSLLEFAEEYCVFRVRNTDTEKTSIYEYNLKTKQLNKHGDYDITICTVFKNKLAYQMKKLDLVNGKYKETTTFMLKGGAIIEKYVRKNELDKAFMRISPKGDIYIIKIENDIYKITKNGQPYNFDGKISTIVFENFSPSTDEWVVGTEIKRDMHHSYDTDVRLNIGTESIKIKGAYSDGFSMADNGNVVFTKHTAPDENNRLQKLCKNGQDVLEKTWKHLEDVAITANGDHFAILACNYDDFWPTNNTLGYYTTNLCMAQNWNLIVDGKALEGKFGAPTCMKSENKLVAIKQIGNRLEIVDLITQKPYSGTLINNESALNEQNTNLRLKNLWKKTFLNIEKGPASCTQIQPGWYSAMWIFEPVNGTQNVRIKSRWKNTYLNIESGSVQCSAIQPGWSSAKWVIEKIAGTNQIRIKNVWKNTYLNIESGSLQCTAIQSGWSSAKWELDYNVK